MGYKTETDLNYKRSEVFKNGLGGLDFMAYQPL